MQEIYALVKDDFDQLDLLVQESLRSSVSLVEDISHHIIQSGGKRLRPLITLLAARAVHCPNQDHVILATIVEFLHTATLLHDDVVDESVLRRGNPTANKIWGNAASVLVGDFLYSRAFQLMTRLNNLSVYRLLADATNTLSQGEVLQLMYCHKKDMALEEYLEVIRCKTAALFSAAAGCGALVAQGDAVWQSALAQYGLHLGMAFQMLDDWLDYSSSAGQSGKNPGNDLTEGKITLPLLYALLHGTPEENQKIYEALEKKSAVDLPFIIEIFEKTHVEKHLFQSVRQEIHAAKCALTVLPETIYKKSLFTLAESLTLS